MGYTKLFTEIIMSTVWREKDHVRLLWITMLALKDRWHVVNASLPGLADSARITIAECEDALKVLSSPDAHSRTKDFEGRRIEECDGGWTILNGEKYRNKMSIDERREYQRIKQKEYRDRKKNVKSCLQSSQQFTHTEAETKEDTNKVKRKGFIKPSVSDVMEYCQSNGHSINAEQFVDFYTANGWKVGKNSMKDWKATIRNWERRDKGNEKDTRSRAKRLSDKLDDIARKDIEENGFPDFVD